MGGEDTRVRASKCDNFHGAVYCIVGGAHNVQEKALERVAASNQSTVG